MLKISPAALNSLIYKYLLSNSRKQMMFKIAPKARKILGVKNITIRKNLKNNTVAFHCHAVHNGGFSTVLSHLSRTLDKSNLRSKIAC